MPRILSPQEVAALGLEQPSGPRALSPEEVAHLGLEDGPSVGAALAEGAGQGASLGFADELEGGYKALAKKLLPKSLGGTDKGFADQYREDRDIARARAAAAEAAHPTAYMAGNLGGGLATAALTPELGIAKGLAGAVGAGVGIGAANGLGSSNADLTKGEVGRAAYDTTMGGLTGGAMAAGGTALAEAAPIVGRKLNEAANSLAARTLKGTSTQYKNLGREGVQDMGKFLLDNQAVRFGSSPEAVAQRVAQLEESTGQNLGNTISALDQTTAPAYRATFNGPGSPPPGATINMAYGAGGVSKTEIAQSMVDEANRLLAQKGPGANGAASRLHAAAQEILDTPGPDRMSFAQAERWKTTYAQNAKWDKVRQTPPIVGDKEVASTFRQGVENEAQKAAQGTDLADQFLDAKRQSGLAQKANEIAEGAEGRRIGRNIVSPSGSAVQLGGAMTAVASGHPAGIVPAIASGVAYQFAKTRAPAALAVASKGTGDLLQRMVVSNPASLGKYGAILSNALQSGGQSALDAHAYVLGQTDPQFQQLQQKLGEQSQ